MTMRYLMLLFLLAIPLHASSEDASLSFGEWVLTATDDTIDIKTINESDSALVMVCTKGKDCFFAIVSETRCEKDGDYSALLNTDISAHPVNLRCNPFVYHGKQKYGLMLKDEDASKPSTLIDLLSKTKNIGFAIALEGGRFKSLRFSAHGFLDAMLFMIKAIDDYKKHGSDEIL